MLWRWLNGLEHLLYKPRTRVQILSIHSEAALGCHPSAFEAGTSRSQESTVQKPSPNCKVQVNRDSVSKSRKEDTARHPVLSFGHHREHACSMSVHMPSVTSREHTHRHIHQKEKIPHNFYHNYFLLETNKEPLWESFPPCHTLMNYCMR